MISIPDISFKSSEGVTEIEFLSLKELFSRVEKDPNHNPKLPHRITFFALLIVTAGKGDHQVDLKKYDIGPSSVVKIAKGQVHAFQNDFKYDGYLVIFTEEFVLKYFSKSSIDFISHLYNYHISDPLVNNVPFNQSFIEQVTHELQNSNTYAQKEIVAKLMELYLLRLERLTHSITIEATHKKHQSLFIQFKDLVEQNYTQTRNVKDYAILLQISPKHLNYVVKEVTINTAKHFIDNYVILEIKRLIISTTKSLKEIAFQNGFDEVTNFTKFFKKHTGLSPKEFKTTV